MNRKLLALLASSLVMVTSVASQAATIGFESLPLPAAGYFFPGVVTGSSPSAVYSFTESGATFQQNFDDYGLPGCCWNGWSYSNRTDTTTPGDGNQYSSIAGSGAGLSAQYAVAYVPYMGTSDVVLSGLSTVGSVSISNTTYAALTMRDGDQFATKFGGASGNVPDYFKLTVTGYNGAVATQHVDFFLADYRFADNSQDYILQGWNEIDLSALGAVTRLAFSIDSSNSGVGTYFAMDNLTIAAVPEPEQAALLLGGLVLLAGIARRRSRSGAR